MKERLSGPGVGGSDGVSWVFLSHRGEKQILITSTTSHTKEVGMGGVHKKTWPLPTNETPPRGSDAAAHLKAPV